MPDDDFGMRQAGYTMGVVFKYGASTVAEAVAALHDGNATEHQQRIAYELMGGQLS